MTTNENQIRELLAAYERSLNTSDADLAASCYTADGIFMPTTLPTVTGADMADGYRQIFDAIRLNVTFTIDELVVTSDDTAYALTHSNGTQTVLATDDEAAEFNREVFLFRRTDTDSWKISRCPPPVPISPPAPGGSTRPIPRSSSSSATSAIPTAISSKSANSSLDRTTTNPPP